MRHYLFAALLAALGLTMAGVSAADTTVQMHRIDEQGIGDVVGTVTISESEYGLVFTPQLEGITPGIHGFHVHENPSCEPTEKDGKTMVGGAAGGHFDPDKAGKHGFPWGDGHRGDLPALVVDSDGNATYPVLAPRLKNLSDVAKRSLMVHVGGDNYSDDPKPLGGGGARMVCGVIS